MSYEFSCTDAGAACNWQTQADDQEQLLQKVGDHLQKKHDVAIVSNTLANYALRVAKER